MGKEIAICIGSKSVVDKEKFVAKFDEYETGYTLTFHEPLEHRSGTVSLAASLVQRAGDAAVWVVVQGTSLDDSKGQRVAEEVQILVEGASLPFVSYLFWDTPITPEELLAQQLYQMLTREVPTRH